MEPTKAGFFCSKINKVPSKANSKNKARQIFVNYTRLHDKL